MSNTRLLQAAMPAERMCGAKFCEDFRDHLSMIKGGWTLTGAPLFAKNGGMVLNGTSQYTSIPLGNELASTTITVHLEWIPTAAFAAGQVILDTSATNRFCLADRGGGKFGVYLSGTQIHLATYAVWNALLLVGKRNVLTITKLAGAAAIVWLNGSVVANEIGVVAPSGAATTPLLVGKDYGAAAYYAGTISRLLIGHYLCTLAEHQAYYNRTMWNWEDRCLVNLQMRVGDFDPTGVRTLDSSGNGNHFTLGDGATPAYYPAQSTGKMIFGGSPDWLQSASRPRAPGAFTALFCGADKSGATTSYWGTQGGSNWMLLRVASGAYRFYVGGALYAVSSAFFDQRVHTVACVYDGSLARIYVDGFAGTPSAAVAPVGANSRIFIGCNDGLTQPITGDMYDFKYREGESFNQVMCLDYHQRMMSRLGAEQ